MSLSLFGEPERMSGNIATDVAGGAAAGSVLGPVGAIAGAAGGILSSIFGGSAEKDAAKQAAKAAAAQKKELQIQVAAEQQSEVFRAGQDALAAQRNEKLLLVGVASIAGLVIVSGLVWKITRKKAE